MKLFLDIDGVLLGVDPHRSSRAALAPHACEFLEFALSRCSVHWLTTHCRGRAAPAVQHLVRHTPQSERERVLGLAGKIRPTRFETFKTEALPRDQDAEPFVWLDDSPTGAELDWLRARGWLDRWLWIDTREEPDDLLRARRWLEERLERAAGADA
ncbi:MAG: hypothetical protein ACON4Z_06875 [Planctomycetota bacterium]